MAQSEKPAAPSFAKATLVLAGGTALGQVATVAVSPLVSRLYSTQEVGILGAFATIVSTLAPIVCLRYEAAISVPKSDDVGVRLLWASLASSAVVSAVTGVLALVLGGALCTLLNAPGLAPYLWLLPVSLLGLGTYQALTYWALREREFKLAAATKTVQGLTQAVAQVAFGFLRLGALGLVLGDVLGRVTGGGSIALRARARLKGQTRPTAGDVWETAKDHRAFPLVSGPATLLHTATTTFPLVLTVIYGAAAYGQFYFGMRFLWAPVALVGQAMAQVYLAEASRWAREDAATLKRSFDRIVRRLAVAGLVPFGLLALLGGPLVALVFGEPWRPAGTLVQVQALSWWAMFAVGPVLNTLNILGRQSWQLWADAVVVVAMAASFWACWRYGLVLTTGVALYSGCLFGLYVWLYLACRRAVARHNQGSTFDPEPGSGQPII